MKLLIFAAGLALGAFLAVLLLMPQVWKKEPEYDPFIEPWGDQ